MKNKTSGDPGSFRDLCGKCIFADFSQHVILSYGMFGI